MNTKINAKFIYFTIGSFKEAKILSTALVSKELVACANILGSSTAIYRWNGEIVEDGEIVVLLKTTQDLAKLVIEKIKELHSYDCPAIVALNIEDGNRDFLLWIDENTK